MARIDVMDEKMPAEDLPEEMDGEGEEALSPEDESQNEDEIP